MSTCLEVVLPWEFRDDGVGVPVNPDDVDSAVEVVMMLAQPDSQSLIVEQASQATFEFSLRRSYSARTIDTVREQISRALSSPDVTAGEVVPHEWCIRGCTVSTYHPIDGAAADSLHLTARLPSRTDEVVAHIISDAPRAPRLEVTSLGWEAAWSNLRVRICDMRMDEYDALYDGGSADDPYRWVAAIGRGTMGLGNAVYASSPVIRPDHGGFLEFFGRVVAHVRSATAARRAIPGRCGAPWTAWLIARTSTYIGWVAMPSALAKQPQGDQMRYLHRPESLDAGWVQMRQRLFADDDQERVVPMECHPTVTSQVHRTFEALVDRETVVVEVCESSVAGIEPWWWMRLSLAG